MNNLIQVVEELKKSEIRNIVEKRMIEFRNNNNIFSELCFCILTANFNAERSIKIQNELGKGFSNLSEDELKNKLKELGHRFPNRRAEFIVLARQQKENVCDIVKTKSEHEIREWIVKNIKGIGYKEASHFMRNIGFENVAIIDFHIIDVLVKNNLIQRPKTLTRKKYMETEKILRQLADRLELTLAELDLYLWYLETGKILK